MLFENMSRLENISKLIKMTRQKYLNRNNSEKPVNFNYHFKLRLFNYKNFLLGLKGINSGNLVDYSCT